MRRALALIALGVLVACGSDSTGSSDSTTTTADPARQVLIEACEAARQERVHDTCPGDVDERLAMFDGKGCDTESVVAYLRASFIVDQLAKEEASYEARTPCIAEAIMP